MASFIANPRDPECGRRLFCLPHSGGGSARYYTWRLLLAPRIEVVPIQLPGREMRYQEEPYTRLDRLIDDLVVPLSPYLDKPYAVFGYSVGAYIGFELVREIRRRGLLLPQAFLVAAAKSPEQEPPQPFIHQMSDTDLLHRINTRYGGIPEIILNEKQLLQIYLRAIKADFALMETYVYYEEKPFDFPIMTFGGEQDRMVVEEDLAGWRAHTSGAFSLSMMPGDHFFVQEQQGPLLEQIKEALASFSRRSEDSGKDAP